MYRSHSYSASSKNCRRTIIARMQRCRITSGIPNIVRGPGVEDSCGAGLD
jgi:hypothetical protein